MVFVDVAIIVPPVSVLDVALLGMVFSEVRVGREMWRRGRVG